ncbi:MAG: AlbA family DNA-binding domain-containing protein [Longimicrobiales bacterium]
MLPRLDNVVLQSLLDSAARESSELDFKSDFNPDNPDHRRGLIDDVCALANARGGWLLLGVAEEAGAASELPGLQVDDQDALRRRLIQMVESGLEPRLSGLRIECVPVAGGRHVVGIRVPQSWSGPHRTSGSRRFMVRGDGGNSEYDIQGLRQAFLARDHATQVWEAFRNDRIARYYADRLPLAVQAGPAALIHLFPLSAAGPATGIDLAAAAALPAFAPARDNGWGPRHNLDGIVRRGQEHEGASTHYGQIFRNGALEAFLALDPQVGRPGLALPWLQNVAATLLPRWLAGLSELGVAGPYQFAITLVGVQGMQPLRGEGGYPAWGNAAREDTLQLPAWYLDPAEIDAMTAAALLEELRVLLHHAFGRDGIGSRHF